MREEVVGERSSKSSASVTLASSSEEESGLRFPVIHSVLFTPICSPYGYLNSKEVLLALQTP